MIISPIFNEELTDEYLEIMSKFNKVIFNNYELNDKLFEAYKNYRFIGLKYVGNYFNKPVDNLPNSLTHLTFGNYFNKPVNNLSSSLTH